jgi:membrane-associated phospholipid phosphatase
LFQALSLQPMPTPVLLVSFFQRLWTWLSELDTWLFLKINTVWTSPFFDSVLPWWREANTWAPLYLFLVIFGLLNFKKTVLPWILFAVVTVTITDQLSSTLIKNWVARPRPCRDEFLAGQVRLLLSNCSGTYSFTSSHAANHFGFAMFIVLTLRPVLKKWGWLFFAWAASVAYAQVYVGIHYPLDVICGGMLGCAAGYLTGSFFNKKIGPINLNHL